MKLFVRLENSDKVHFAEKAACWFLTSHVDTYCGRHELPEKYENNTDAVDCSGCISGVIDRLSVAKEEKVQEKEVREPLYV